MTFRWPNSIRTRGRLLRSLDTALKRGAHWLRQGPRVPIPFSFPEPRYFPGPYEQFRRRSAFVVLRLRSCPVRLAADLPRVLLGLITLGFFLSLFRRVEFYVKFIYR